MTMPTVQEVVGSASAIFFAGLRSVGDKDVRGCPVSGVCTFEVVVIVPLLSPSSKNVPKWPNFAIGMYSSLNWLL